MDVRAAAIPEVKLILTRRHGDARGFFSETWNHRAFAAAGILAEFVQDNHTHSAAAGTVRGLHFQIEPVAQAKLIRCPKGAIFDVAVDVRRSSPTFGRHVAQVLSADDWNQLFVPKGFAHGYCTLRPDTEVIYKVTNYYSPEHERGVLWNDPALRIAWPISPEEALVNERDRGFPPLSLAPELFA